LFIVAHEMKLCKHFRIRY